jgi:cysteine desulfurase
MENQEVLKTTKTIYLDYNASSPLHPDLLRRIPEVLSHFGNPSSIHWAGREAKAILRQARENIAKALGVQALEIIFTSGGSESNTSVLLQTFTAEVKNSTRNELIISNIEHPSISQCAQFLKSQGVIVHEIKVDREGNFDWEHFSRVLSEKTALVSVMLANNETGLLLPIKEIASRAHACGAKMHTDAVQAFGKIPLDLRDLNVDYASFSAHKFYSLKGSGVLYVKKASDVGTLTLPLIFGGGQERKRRGGTENLLGIWAMGFMAGLSAQIAEQAMRMKDLRDLMEKRISQEIPEAKVTHARSLRLPNTSSVILSQVDGDTLLMSLDVKGFAISTGSACSSGRPEPSRVLQNIGLSRMEAQNSLRISLGWMSTEEEIHLFVDCLKGIVERLRMIEQSEAIRIQDGQPQSLELR